MHEERSLDEINAHRHSVLPEAELYRVTAIRFEQDLDVHQARLSLRVRNKKTGEVCSLQFSNPVFNSDPFMDLRDTTGLYLMTTDHLGWDPAQRIEVGDWDGNPPLFWAEEVKRTEEQDDSNNEIQPTK